MINRLKRTFIILSAVLAVLCIISAGASGEDLRYSGEYLTERSGWKAAGSAEIIALILSGWFLLLGMMCKRLEKIPGISRGQKNTGKRKR